MRTQRLPSHGKEVERRVGSITGQIMKTQDVVSQRGQTESMARKPPLRWRQALQILAVLLCLVVVLHAVTNEHVQRARGPLRALAGRHRIALGGAAATSAAPVPDGVRLLTGDLITEATLLTTLIQDTQ